MPTLYLFMNTKIRTYRTYPGYVNLYPVIEHKVKR